MWDAIYPYLAALLPTAGILAIVYVVFRTIFEADRKERKAVAQWEAEHGRPAGHQPADDAAGAGSSDDPARPS